MCNLLHAFSFEQQDLYDREMACPVPAVLFPFPRVAGLSACKYCPSQGRTKLCSLCSTALYSVPCWFYHCVGLCPLLGALKRRWVFPLLSPALGEGTGEKPQTETPAGRSSRRRDRSQAFWKTLFLLDFPCPALLNSLLPVSLVTPLSSHTCPATLPSFLFYSM